MWTPIPRISINKLKMSRSKSFCHINAMPLPDRVKLCNVHDENVLIQARQCLQNGEVIALPTDTVYGLACDANNEPAIQRLYSIKGRDFKKPVAICVPDLQTLRRYGEAAHLKESFLKQLLPGPLTLVLKRTPELSNKFLNPNTNKIGIRIPDSDFIKKLCMHWNRHPLALTSANRSSEPSTLNVEEFKSLWPHLGAIIDAGPIALDEQCRQASTVIDLSIPGYFEILRAGIALESTVQILCEYGFKLKNDL